MPAARPGVRRTLSGDRLEPVLKIEVKTWFMRADN
jgi:hypothetical protein